MKNKNNIIIDKTYSAKGRKTGKFGLPSDYSSVVSLLMLNVIEKFMDELNKLYFLRGVHNELCRR